MMVTLKLREGRNLSNVTLEVQSEAGTRLRSPNSPLGLFSPSVLYCILFSIRTKERFLTHGLQALKFYATYCVYVLADRFLKERK